MPAGVKNHPGFIIGEPGQYLPTELIVRISFFATSSDQWFRLDSMRILYEDTAKHCHERNYLGEIL